MESVVDTLRTVDITGKHSKCKLTINYSDIIDNHLICDCELKWYSEWLNELKDDMDDAMLKKRVVCTMTSEHREYNLQDLPLEKMNCVGKSQGQTRSNSVCHRLNAWNVLVPILFFVA